MSEKKLICRADISFKCPNVTKIVMIIWYIVAIVASVLLSLPRSDEGDVSYHFMGMWVGSDYGSGFSWDDGASIAFAVGIMIIIVAFVIPIILYMSNFKANQCILSLWDDSIRGELKTTFSKKEIRLPIEKLDNVMVVEGFFDRIRGGKTIEIRSNSGLIKFHWVHNADEFVAATLQRIEAFKKNAAATPTAAAPAPAADASLSEKLQELQSLKDQGILTDEQFEAKKQELIAKF